MERDPFEKPITLLTEARKTLSQAWSGFGGTDGTEVTMESIEEFLMAKLAVAQLEKKEPLERRVLINFLERNPLVSLPPNVVILNNPAVQVYASEWLRGEKTRLNLLKVIEEVGEQIVMEEPEGLLGIPEIERQITACTAAIELLEVNLADKRG